MDLETMDPALAVRLRQEAHGMADAYVEALRSKCAPESVVGIYLKGSAHRPWHSAIDYVPELSDVDIHVRLSARSPASRSLEFALDVAEAALDGFHRRFQHPAHTPRPQLFFLDELEGVDGYVPSPNGSVQTLFGREYATGGRDEYVDCLPSDASRLAADARFMADELPGKVIDRPGVLLWPAVARITWRVGPAAPRLLTQLGMDPYEAWSVNRSAAVQELAKRGHRRLAEHYSDFYMAGWDGFRSGFTDEAAARRALTAASRLFVEGTRMLEDQKAKRD